MADPRRRTYEQGRRTDEQGRGTGTADPYGAATGRPGAAGTAGAYGTTGTGTGVYGTGAYGGGFGTMGAYGYGSGFDYGETGYVGAQQQQRRDEGDEGNRDPWYVGGDVGTEGGRGGDYQRQGQVQGQRRGL